MSLEEIVSLQRTSLAENLLENSKGPYERALLDGELEREAHEYAKFWKRYNEKSLPERYQALRPKESVLLTFPEPQTAYFSKAISELNFARVLRIMARIPEFKYNKEFLRYCLATKNFGGANKKELFPEALNQVQWNNQHARARFKKKATTAVPRDEDGACIEWIFESMGYNTADWSLDFYSGARFAKQSRFGGPDYPRTDLLKIFSAVFPKPATVLSDEGEVIFDPRDEPKVKAAKLLGYYQSKAAAYRPDQQERLSKRDMVLLASGERAPLVYGHCIRCHASPSIKNAPPIPFDNLTELHAQGPVMMSKIMRKLSDEIPEKFQMPPDVPLTRGEKQQIIDFISGHNMESGRNRR